MDARAANDRIAAKAAGLHFVSRVPMLCECEAEDCRTLLMIGLPEYADLRRNTDRFLLAPGHEIAGTALETETPRYAIRRARRSPRAGDSDRRSA